MRFLPVLFAAMACPFASIAADPNALGEKEIADGWILLFDGQSTTGWKVDGEVAVKDGVLVLGGTKATKAFTTASLAEAAVRIEAEWEGQAAPSVRTPGKRVDTEAQKKAYESSGTAEKPEPILSLDVPEGTRVRLRSAKARPLGTKPLFDGKSLAGWKVNEADPKRVASKFEVTKEGELHVTNGPGDLRTEAKFGDFVLQLECKTNGTALNSGIFFRCIPDQYQNGYEMQIQNAFKDGDRTKPTDFGTGAIYRRIAARKVVSNDKEWFAMTLIANGPHLATWVNGVQVVDWTDDRKPDENPRKGVRTEAGHLSIQGHDPTTDLLFRNLRIAELPQAR